jgi:type II secretory pathway pseudopilin PulG
MMERVGCPTERAARPVATAGTTLVELLIAVVIFAVAVAVAGRSIVGFVGQVAVSELRAQALEFAVQELERVRLLPYEEIVARAAQPVPEAPGFTRSVAVSVTGLDPSDLYAYRLITVTVVPPAGAGPVSVSTAVSE